ncbi:[FeFe] hydrogenase H-cluster maturation GTPase HydF [Maridesulfovibrio ferrireducens]|uniref:[FeFe] hydrogenase H-cluster maturation GTPase HydF n=1 Tax=Maridesulfovibrio ferrireducens TaxID=246191 RepID=A0A1G9KDP7_9BACT|nr:[FeFe] hydrogenase H-cluster maturation GTPase HydF [Maridesulfovibrio ferrireducens]SDL47443.1 [FeFe] hydrogenase H-cluster maturation GTPase HydF [Maridesulfovibrio ferrireducens]
MSPEIDNGSRLAIAIAGRSNAGKSSIIRALSGVEGDEVLPVAQEDEMYPLTRTEISPLGPVTIYDTDAHVPGDDKTILIKKALYSVDVAVVVTDESGIADEERELTTLLLERRIPCVMVFNKADIRRPSLADMEFCGSRGIRFVATSTVDGRGIERLKKSIMALAPEENLLDPVLARDLIGKGDYVICAISDDPVSPKGRLGLPKSQVLREILDVGGIAVLVKEGELFQTISGQKRRPALVIADSQAVKKVMDIIPADVLLTTFPILFARHKGNLEQLVQGANAIDQLKDGDRILIVEACPHHPKAEDFSKEMIPDRIAGYSGKKVTFELKTGCGLPLDLSSYQLVVHCGACMTERVDMLRRIRDCERQQVPITNYGLAAAKVDGTLKRLVEPFFKDEAEEKDVISGKINVFRGSNSRAMHLVVPAEIYPEKAVPFNLMYLFGDIDVTKKHIGFSSLPFARGGQQKIRKFVEKHGYCFYKWPGRVLGPDLGGMLEPDEDSSR